MIELLNVNKEYQDQHALDHLSLTINDGELFVLVGPSGSGKTTLLKTINRLVVPTSGQVKIDGKDVAEMNLQQLRRQVGYVLQTGALFPNMTVAENASVQLDNLKWPVEKKRARIAELMTEVGLDPDHFLDRMPSELSGGEAQRVGIVRALACKPGLVLMDEPFSALDPVSRRQLQQIVINLHHELDSTIVFVTHDMHEALRLADRIAVVHNGKLQQVGTPTEILAEPANAFVSNFFADEQQTDQLLGQVLASGFGRPAKPDEPGTRMVKGQSIFEWATALRESQLDQVIVDDKVLTDHDLIDYLASLEMEGDSH
ncbi:ABC transporter ATP-binding protein [Secundilactobacillus yichangensis]|uniref:ABC transporter ATP-binding protein n=1 Tax=Secundilactobacillus yichangensis TaxID=2799580 RepID=UPI001944012E|nr:ABC transporter ATP-binding protein [Secundilactobacillus yichangensis]